MTMKHRTFASNRRRVLASRALAHVMLAAGLTAPAFAQEISGPSADDATSRDVVVVTARLREENAQDVPVALSVVGGDTITKSNTNNVSQLS